MIVTTFASNAARLETIGRVAEETGRRVCVAGRSLDRILKVAKATGYCAISPNPCASTKRCACQVEVLVVATGGQGSARRARPDRVRQP